MNVPSVAFLRPTEILVSRDSPTPTACVAEPQQTTNARCPEWLVELWWCRKVPSGLGTFPLVPISQRMGCWPAQGTEKIQQP